MWGSYIQTPRTGGEDGLGVEGHLDRPIKPWSSDDDH